MDSQSLDKGFIKVTQDFRDYLKSIKEKFDELDSRNLEEKKQIHFVDSGKEEIFRKLDAYFHRTWEIVKNFDKGNYKFHQHYYQRMLDCFLIDPIEINRHIRQKPLGYSGDFEVMNYIYDYYKDRYLGNSSFEKLINNYTCGIPISRSNIKRKEFLKEKIAETIKQTDQAKILSVACGPTRELLELLREGKINKQVFFKCLDFEKRALDYIKNEIDKIDWEKKRFLSSEYICRDITSIIRHKELKESLKDQDLIYAFGIFDYLSERMALRLSKELYQLLRKGGNLIICNASLKNSSHRPYYELIGEWNMVYRNEEEMLSWMEGIGDISQIKFEQSSSSNKYLFFSIKK